MSVHTEALRKYIGKPAKDIYGRYVGYVVGLSLDPMGQLNSIGIDQGSGGFFEYHGNQVMIDNDNLIIIPTWKIECDKYREENQLTQKRFQALDDLLKNGEIPQYVYEELCKQYTEAMNRLQETHGNLINTLKGIIEDLERQSKSLERFLGNIKVQHKTGEMNDETYKVASEYLMFGITNAANEKKDILNILDKLVSPTETSPTSPQPVPTQPTVATQPTIEAPKPSEESQPRQPLILRLRTTED